MKKFLLSLAVLGAAFGAYAQDAQPKEELPEGATSVIADTQLASELVRYGFAHKVALPFIEAMQIINENPPTVLKAEKEGEKALEVDMGGKTGNITLNYDEIVANAKLFAEGNETLLALIDELSSQYDSSSRGAVGGPEYAVELVNARGTDVYHVRFAGGALAEVGVSGDGDTDLDLYVYDSNNNLVVYDDDPYDDCYVCWVPRYTATYTIKVVNRGNISNRYVIVTN